MKLCALSLLACLSAATVYAQSGTADWAPMLNPDPRLAAIHSAQGGRLRAPTGVAISPDAALVAWAIGGRGGTELHVTDLANPDPAKDKIVSIAGTTSCSNSAPVWSPDSQTLAFTSTCTSKDEKPGQPQIFLWSRATGEAKQLTHVTGIFQQAMFSSDGKTLAFLFVENATRSAGALAAMKPWSGVIGEDGVEIQRVYNVRLDGGKGEFMTPADLHVYEFQFSPVDHDLLTFIAAPPRGENNWWVAKLYVKGERAPRVVFDPVTSKSALHGLQIAVPRFSSDGKKIAFIGGLMSDQGSTGGDVWVVDSKGGEPTDVTPNIDGTPVWVAWISDHTVAFVEDRRGHTLISAVNVNDSKIVAGAPMDLGEVSVAGGPIKSAISYSDRLPGGKDRVVAFIKSGHATPPEIWTGQAASLTQLTHLNDGATPPGHTESVEWKNEGFDVQGWLTYPKDYNPAKKYALIVSVHGGPSASAGANWNPSIWSELGYFVFAPNPRGSFGEGEKFTAANIKDFGYGDLRDITSGMDFIEKKVSIDKTREGLTGGSYGGFMSMFGVTQTTRFRAAIAVAGISNWESYYGENSIDQWMIPFFGASVYDDPKVYAKSSAIEFIKKVKTPTLIVVGDRDGECPPPQSFEMWHALKAEGVPTQLVIYPNEGHGIRQAEHARDLEARELAWWDKYMPAS